MKKIDWDKMGIGPRMMAVAKGEAEEGPVVYVCPCENSWFVHKDDKNEC